MRKIGILILLEMFSLKVNDQINLVPNGSFDDNLPQPDLTQPASLLGYYNTLGKWGTRVVGRKVTSTDTLWRLAKAYYGDGNKMSVIRYFNGLAETDVIHDGQILLIPEPTLNGMISTDRVPVGSTQAGPIQ